MKIKIFTLLAALMAGIFATCQFAQAQEKIGYADVYKIFDDYNKTKEYDKILEKKGEEKEREREKLVGEIKSMRDKLELLSNKAREEQQALIDKKIQALQEFDKTAREDLRKERDGIMKDILEEIDRVIKEYGAENDYTLILNDKVLLYKDESMNLTSEILRRLNERYRK